MFDPPTESIDELLLQAIELEHADERERFLASRCGHDERLQRELRSLLEAHFAAGKFLNVPLVARSTFEASEQIGNQLGPYRLIEQIGEGGMGVVYRAEQTSPVRREVAIKLIKPGMDSREVIVRFEAERQALAVMDHPHIARVFDAAATDTGRPYFVMELVRGVPITRYCEDQCLPATDRLQLMIDVCRAVQHAHMKGIIHRDIKPGNVLVTQQDGTPVVKVIDFGVAKAIDQEHGDVTLVTRFAQFIGTPLYMSPEQAQEGLQNIDTRTDVYSLGVLLYELLTGTTPFERSTLNEVGFDEFRRMIREDPPPRPSDRISTLSSQVAVGAATGTAVETSRLGKSLRGEIDWIVMCALEKDRERRYESASALANDIQRFLNREPVEACPPSLIYRVRSRIRRHRAAILLGGSVSAALVIGTTVAIWQAMLARQSEVRAAQAAVAAQEAQKAERTQRERAEKHLATAQNVVDQMLTRVSGWMTHLPHTTHVRRQLLLEARNYYRQFVADQPADPETQFELANAYHRIADIERALGRLADAIQNYQAAGEILSKILQQPNDSLDRESVVLTLAECHLGLGKACMDQGRTSDAIAYFRTAIETQGKVALEQQTAYQRSQLATGCNHLAVALRGSDRSHEIRSLLEQSRQIRAALALDAPQNAQYQSDLAATLNNLAMRAIETEQHAEAVQLLTTAAAHQTRAIELEPTNTNFRKFLSNHHSLLAEACGELGDYERSRREFQQAIQHATKLRDQFPAIPEFAAIVASNWNRRGIQMFQAGQTDESEQAFAEAVTQWKEITTEYPEIESYETQYLDALNNLAVLQMELSKLEKAEDVFRTQVDYWQEKLNEQGNVPLVLHNLGGSLSNLGMVLRHKADYDEALKVLSQAIKHQSMALDLDSENSQFRQFLLNHHWQIASVYSAMKNETAAISHYRQCLKLQPGNASSHNELAWLLANSQDAAIRDPAAAVAHARQAVVAEPDEWMYWDTLGVALYRNAAWGPSIEAMQMAIQRNGHQRSGDQLFILAMAHWQLDQHEQALGLFREAVSWMQENNPEDTLLKQYLGEAQGLIMPAESNTSGND